MIRLAVAIAVVALVGVGDARRRSAASSERDDGRERVPPAHHDPRAGHRARSAISSGRRSTTADVQSFQYPADGSIVSVGRSRAAVFASAGSGGCDAVVRRGDRRLALQRRDRRRARSPHRSRRARAPARPARTSAASRGSGAPRARQRHPERARATMSLEDWGTLTVLSTDSGSRKAGPPGAQASVDGAPRPPERRSRRPPCGERDRDRKRAGDLGGRPLGAAAPPTPRRRRPPDHARRAPGSAPARARAGRRRRGRRRAGAGRAGGVRAALVRRLRLPRLRDGVLRRQLRRSAAERSRRLASRRGHLRRRRDAAPRRRRRDAAHDRLHQDRRLPTVAARHARATSSTTRISPPTRRSRSRGAASRRET